MKRFFLAALCAILLLGAVSCAKKEEKPTETKDPNATRATEEKSEPDWIAPLPESEILYEIEAEVGTGETGPLTDVDAYKVYPIREKKDLDPFRSYFPELSADKEAKYLSEEGGATFVIEITATNDYSYYGISSVTQAAGNLIVVISSGEDEFPTPPHTFFMLHFPPEIYRGEAIQVLFE